MEDDAVLCLANMLLYVLDGAVKLWDLATTDGFPVADWREHDQGTYYSTCTRMACLKITLVPGLP